MDEEAKTHARLIDVEKGLAIACGVPARFLQRFFRARGMGDVPIMAFPQNPYPGIGTVRFDCEQIAARAIDLFRRRGCRHVVFVVRVIEYIQANACRPGGIDQRDIAKHLGVALRTLQLHFEESTFAGTILEDIQRVKLAKVCELLTKAKRPIAEITRLAGFRTHSCLKTAFRKKFGTSMAAYRKAQRSS